MNTKTEIEARVKIRKGSVNLLFLLLISLCLLSCTSEKAADVTARNDAGPGTGAAVTGSGGPQQSLRITPSAADRNSTLTAVPGGFNLYDAKYAWSVNGEPVSGASSCTFRVCDCSAKKGDSVQAKAVINGREIISNSVIIGNTPPELTAVKLMPEVFKPGDTLYIDAAARDFDGDQVTIACEWTKNGQSAGTGKSIGCPVKRGDRVTVKVTPFDGERYGRPVVLETDIKNMPPSIVSDKKYDFEGGVFSYRVHATDPDGDALVYSLKTAPSGMIINASTGLITWRVPAEFSGKTSFTVSAGDGNGGLAMQTFNFEIK